MRVARRWPRLRWRQCDIAMAIWSVISVCFWIFYSFVSHAIFPLALYYPLWLGIVGTLVWRHRAQIRRTLLSWRAAAPVKFVVLGFGAVLSEEILAAIANHVPEGFSPALFAVRIVQF